MWPRYRLMTLTLLAVVVVAVIGVAFYWKSDESIEPLLGKAERAAQRSDFQSVEKFALQVLSRDPDSTRALFLAGQAVAEQGRAEDALGYFERVADDGTPVAIDCRCAAGEVLLLLSRRVSDAERQFRRALKQQPDHPVAHERLAFLLGLSGRSWESIPHRLKLIRYGQQTALQLYLLSLGDRAVENRALVQQYSKVSPRDHLLMLATAGIAIKDQKYSRAKNILRQVIEAQPALIEPQRMLGQVLLETRLESEFFKWHAGLLTSGDEHPGIWESRGLWAKRRGESKVAVRCFWESVRLDPNRPQTNYQLARLLFALGEAEQAEPFQNRAQLLMKYENRVSLARTGGDTDVVLRTAETAESLGLIVEAHAWYNLASAGGRLLPRARRASQRLERRLAGAQLRRTGPESNPALVLDLSSYPLPTWTSDTVAESKESPAIDRPVNVQVSFRDDASLAGLDFSYFNDNRPASRDLTMRATLGGGVAILDFDGDGWPDVYLTQGCRWPPGRTRREHLDRLYRNLGDGRFEDVTQQVGIVENLFSHGVTVGDFDDDGWPDLYVANAGLNRLYKNNGDGTFDDVTASIQTSGRQWTTSCLMADLNGDSWPDIYAVNYLSGKDVFVRICTDSNGKPGVCMPRHFAAAQDRLYLNLGDGRFEDVTTSAGIEVQDGKGLGIVAADFDRSGKLNLFVANDTTQNSYLTNLTRNRGDRPLFREQAFPLGLAVSGRGETEACMGIAVGDVDGDGLTDLLVTNFTNESNTLYQQKADHSFVDKTSTFGLRHSSLPMLGFGTQFLDGDLDGLPDLIVTNGHVNPPSEEGTPYKMPPQFFRNTRAGGYVEMSAKSLGPFFSGRYLGRGLARIDWNRDGLEDVVISHLDRPVALLTNTTANPGHFVVLQLRGTQSSRDAIGTIVELKSGNRSYVRQLTAGDGYLASNQRQLVFGLDRRKQVDKLHVRWPSGLEQTMTAFQADVELLLIEGRPEPVLLNSR